MSSGDPTDPTQPDHWSWEAFGAGAAEETSHDAASSEHEPIDVDHHPPPDPDHHFHHH